MPLPIEELRRIAAGIAERVQQLEAQRVEGPEMVYRMATYLAELQRIWVGADDHQLAALCREFPAFYRYAQLMEDTAAAERARVGPLSSDMPQLRDALGDELAAVLTDAAALQRRYQAAIDASDHNVGELLALHQKWLARREQLLRELAEKEPKAVDFLTLALGEIRNQLASLAQRAGA